MHTSYKEENWNLERLIMAISLQPYSGSMNAKLCEIFHLWKENGLNSQTFLLLPWASNTTGQSWKMCFLYVTVLALSTIKYGCYLLNESLLPILWYWLWCNCSVMSAVKTCLVFMIQWFICICWSFCSNFLQE